MSWLNLDKFLKIGPKQKQTNVVHSATDEIFNSNSKNIGYKVKKEAVFDTKKLCGRILNEILEFNFAEIISKIKCRLDIY